MSRTRLAWPLLIIIQGTRVERTNQELFEGQILNYLQCLNVDYKSERKEPYMDLQVGRDICKCSRFACAA